MQLTPKAVNWDVASELHENGELEEALNESWVEDPYDVRGGELPWPSDSVNQYMHVYESYEKIKDQLSETTKTAGDYILEQFINEDMQVVNDLNFEPSGLGWMGSVSPQTIMDVLDHFSALDYKELKQAYNDLPDDDKMTYTDQNGETVVPSSEDIFTSYFKQWEDMFREADNQGVGIIFHVG